jgi:tRNA(fMet)-specific endonuclease VapC
VLDTDTFSLYLRGHPRVVSNAVRHASAGLALSVITVEELWDGRMAVLAKARTPDQVAAAYDRLAETLNELASWPVVGFPTAAVQVYRHLRTQKLNVKANDLKIGVIALELGAAVVTHNTQDFRRIPRLPVVDWAV